MLIDILRTHNVAILPENSALTLWNYYDKKLNRTQVNKPVIKYVITNN